MKSKTHPKQLLEALSRGGEINYEAFGFGNEYDPQWEGNQVMRKETKKNQNFNRLVHYHGRSVANAIEKARESKKKLGFSVEAAQNDAPQPPHASWSEEVVLSTDTSAVPAEYAETPEDLQELADREAADDARYSHLSDKVRDLRSRK